MPRPGDTISHYKLISAIGKGGMGEVYLAEDSRLERRVAIKILLDDVSDDADRVLRFIREAKAASALNHPNILTVYEVGEHEQTRYIAAELIEGETLRERMKRGGMPLNEAINVALQAATALAAAHQSGILHRDMKPENIMVRPDGLVKVLDFGLAKLTEKALPAVSADAPTLAHVDTQPGLLIGTIAYMSPEQIRGQKLDARTDIFSLGTVMYELFTGHFPFKGQGHLDIASSVLKDDLTPVRQLAPDIPRQLERIIEKALRKDREHRYQHIQDLKIDLEDLQDELRYEAKQATTTTQRRVPATKTERLSLSETISTKRRFTLLHAMVFVGIAALLVGAVWYFRPTAGSQPGKYKITEVASWNSGPGELINNAKFSADGKLIAFSSTRSGGKNIWVTQTGSTDAIPITNDNFSNTDPVWSPKRDEIAFISTGRPGGPGIWRVSALGAAPGRQVAAVDSSARIRTWTSSGRIFYQVKSELYSVDVATGASQKAASFEGQNVSYLDISDDEKTVLVVAQGNEDWHISSGSPAGGALTEIVKGQGHLDGEGIAWLPDKRRILYSAAVNGVSQVFAVDTKSGRTAQLTASDTNLTVTDASPDGTSILVSSSKEESNLWRVAIADGRETPVSRDINMKLWPAVSPDNQRIAFQSIKNLQGDKLYDTAVVAKSSQGAADTDRPTVLAERGVLPIWSPDGKTLAFLRKDAEPVEIFVADTNGGGERRLVSGIMTAGISVSPYNYGQSAAIAWSPDSARIAYVSKKNGASNIWTASLADGAETLLTDNNDSSISYQCPMWSPDGKLIAFSFEKRLVDRSGPHSDGLAVINLDTRQVTAVYESPKFLRLLGWNADNTALISAERDTTKSLQPAAFRRTAIMGPASVAIADLQNVYFYNIFLSDDRKTIAYAARNDDRDDLWTIPSSGGTPRKLTSNNDPGLYYSRLAWLHDGSAIVFGKQTRYSLLSMITDLDQ